MYEVRLLHPILLYSQQLNVTLKWSKLIYCLYYTICVTFPAHERLNHTLRIFSWDILVYRYSWDYIVSYKYIVIFIFINITQLFIAKIYNDSACNIYNFHVRSSKQKITLQHHVLRAIKIRDGAKIVLISKNENVLLVIIVVLQINNFTVQLLDIQYYSRFYYRIIANYCNRAFPRLIPQSFSTSSYW